jgi:integrase
VKVVTVEEWLRVGTNIKVQQELLRHADIQTTLNTYTQARAPPKWEAQSKVVQMVLEKKPLRFLNGSQMGAGEMGGSG